MFCEIQESEVDIKDCEYCPGYKKGCINQIHPTFVDILKAFGVIAKSDSKPEQGADKQEV